MSGVAQREELIDWRCSPYQVSIYEEQGKLKGEVKKEGVEPLFFDPSHLKFGIVKNSRISDVADRVIPVAKSLVAYPYPKENPEEIWVFRGSKFTFIEIAAGKESLLKATADIPVKCGELERAIKHFETALRIAKKVNKGEGEELEEAIKALKNKLFFQTILQTASNFLRNEVEVIHFEDLISGYEDEEDVIEIFELLVDSSSEEPHQLLLSAFVNEKKEQYKAAISDFCRLSKGNVKAFASLERAYALIFSLGSENEAIINEVEAEYKLFLEELGQINKNSKPTCFICFNVEERDVGKWLEKNFVTDLKNFGIDPMFCFWDLNIGANILEFQEKAYHADLTVIACTPALKRKTEDSTKGVAQELDLIKSRLYDKEKENKTFPIYLKGSRKESLPTAYFSATLGAKFTLVDTMEKRSKFNYFYYVFELFASMKGISRQEARETQVKFLDKVREIIRKAGD